MRRLHLRTGFKEAAKSSILFPITPRIVFVISEAAPLRVPKQ